MLPLEHAAVIECTAPALDIAQVKAASREPVIYNINIYKFMYTKKREMFWDSIQCPQGDSDSLCIDDSDSLYISDSNSDSFYIW